MRILVTGAAGFLGRHVLALLEREPEVIAVPVTRDTSTEDVRSALQRADAAIHLAGVNRPKTDEEFEVGNVELTRTLTRILSDSGRPVPLVFSSSSRSGEETPYGRSKRRGEEIVSDYAEKTGAHVAIFRLPNVFGKWSRPFYNSAVATFCHCIARDLPFEVHDPRTTLNLVYAVDVAEAMIAEVKKAVGHKDGRESHPRVEPEYARTLGEIVALLKQFRALRTELLLPDLSDSFVKKLYGTYISFLPVEATAYALRRHTDDRGALAELLKSPWAGQIFLSTTKPGITRGNHFHHTKSEKFVVIGGDAIISMRPVNGGDVTEIRVRGDEMRVVDIPPGYTHSITNTGAEELITLFWASEIFDPDHADTFPLSVKATT